MVKCIDRTGPGNMMKSPLMELCERIDQSRRVALDCSDLGADLVSIGDVLFALRANV